ncbi:helix-turn-helix domain-containing protein [Acidihalobacter prosperus]
MSQEADPSIEESQPSMRREGPGAKLRSAREAAGLSRQEVARSLNLEKGVVEALESDDVERLPEPAYVKGYLRAYARLLDLDAHELLEAYAGLAVPQPEVLPRESASSGGEQRVRLQVVGGLVILILIVVSAWWLTRPRPSNVPPQSQVTAQQAQQTQPTNAVAAPATQTASQAVEPTISGGTAPAQAPAATTANTPSETAAPAADAAKAPSQAATAAASEASTPPAASQASSTPSASSTPAATTTQGAASGSGSGTQLVLQLTAKSWVQIDDSTGTQLFRGLLDAGNRRTFSGTPPFAVFLGYAPGVTLRIDGKQVSAAQYTLSNNTARFTLLADGRTRR